MKEFKHNDHVVAELMHPNVGIDDRSGRLVQIRKGAGAFRSDLYFIRLRDGRLITIENVLLRKVGDRSFEDAFYRMNGCNPPVIPDQPINESDTLDAAYTIKGNWEETGFIIENPSQPPSQMQSFGMMITKGKSNQ